MAGHRTSSSTALMNESERQIWYLYHVLGRSDQDIVEFMQELFTPCSGVTGLLKDVTDSDWREHIDILHKKWNIGYQCPGPTPAELDKLPLWHDGCTFLIDLHPRCSFGPARQNSLDYLKGLGPAKRQGPGTQRRYLSDDDTQNKENEPMTDRSPLAVLRWQNSVLKDTTSVPAPLYKLDVYGCRAPHPPAAVLYELDGYGCGASHAPARDEQRDTPHAGGGNLATATLPHDRYPQFLPSTHIPVPSHRMTRPVHRDLRRQRSPSNTAPDTTSSRGFETRSSTSKAADRLPR